MFAPLFPTLRLSPRLTTLALVPGLVGLLACGGDDPSAPAGSGGEAGSTAAGAAGAAAGSSGTAGTAGAAGTKPEGGGAGGTETGGAGGAGAAGAAGDAGAAGGAGAAGAGAGGAAEGGNGGAGAGGAGVAGAAGAAGMAGTAGAGDGGAGGGVPVCGDGVRADAEACDGADLGGASCVFPGGDDGLPRGPAGEALTLGGGLGALTCGASCQLVNELCEPSFRSIGYVLGPVDGQPNTFDFSENFAWDQTARLYRTSGLSRVVKLPADATIPVGPTLLGFSAPAPTAPAGAAWVVGAGAILPDYPYLRADSQSTHGAFYDPCWDYACDAPSAAAPYKKRPSPRAPLSLRATSAVEDTFIPGSPTPWVLGRGKLRLVVAVAYADTPMGDAELATLFDTSPAAIAAGTSFAAVPPWYTAQSQQHGLESPVDLEIVWSGKQVKIPDDQAPTTFDQCLATSFQGLLTPALGEALAPGDVLVQFYWAKPGISCANHVLRDERAFALFATDTFFSPQGLVVSFAHELMHLFGASDKYTESAALDAQGVAHGCWFEGAPDYDAHDIMCHRVAQVDPTGQFAGFDNPPLGQLGVWPLTSREVGWEDRDGDGALDVEAIAP